MANEKTKILDLIPESLHEQLFAEVREKFAEEGETPQSQLAEARKKLTAEQRGPTSTDVQKAMSEATDQFVKNRKAGFNVTHNMGGKKLE
jgi:hypothetical protein